MRVLNINFPNDIVIESKKAAKSLGITTTAFIRKAVVHELEKLKSDTEINNIINSFNAMKKSKDYMRESEEIYEGLSEDLPEEEDEWWSKT